MTRLDELLQPPTVANHPVFLSHTTAIETVIDLQNELAQALISVEEWQLKAEHAKRKIDWLMVHMAEWQAKAIKAAADAEEDRAAVPKWRRLMSVMFMGASFRNEHGFFVMDTGPEEFGPTPEPEEAIDLAIEAAEAIDAARRAESEQKP